MSTSLDYMSEWNDAHTMHKHHNEDCPFCFAEQEQLEKEVNELAQESRSRMAERNIKTMMGFNF